MSEEIKKEWEKLSKYPEIHDFLNFVNFDYSYDLVIPFLLTKEKKELSKEFGVCFPYEFIVRFLSMFGEEELKKYFVSLQFNEEEDKTICKMSYIDVYKLRLCMIILNDGGFRYACKLLRDISIGEMNNHNTKSIKLVSSNKLAIALYETIYLRKSYSLLFDKTGKRPTTIIEQDKLSSCNFDGGTVIRLDTLNGYSKDKGESIKNLTGLFKNIPSLVPVINRDELNSFLEESTGWIVLKKNKAGYVSEALNIQKEKSLNMYEKTKNIFLGTRVNINKIKEQIEITRMKKFYKK